MHRYDLIKKDITVNSYRTKAESKSHRDMFEHRWLQDEKWSQP